MFLFFSVDMYVHINVDTNAMYENNIEEFRGTPNVRNRNLSCTYKGAVHIGYLCFFAQADGR